MNALGMERQCTGGPYSQAAPAGGSLENGVKTTLVIADMDAHGTINAIDAASFAAQPPARACKQVARLPNEVQIQFEAVALTS